MANGSHDNLTDGERAGLSDTVSPVGDSTPHVETSPEPATGEGATSIDESLVDVVPVRHIFISYKDEDRERVRPLAEALERRGWPVWWDRDIRAGESFRKVITQALDDAACVVVLWSELSVDSEWVQEEAQWARHRNILVPVIFDDGVRQPLGFGQVQKANIAGWSGEADDPVLDDLLTGVATLLGFDYIPPLLDSEEWEAIQEATSASMGAAEARQIESVEAADSAAHLAVRERKAAAAAEAEVEVMAANEAVNDAATRVAAVQAAEQRELAEEAERSAADAEAQAADAAVELAGERAVALRAAAANAAEREARALAAEEAAARAQAERLAQASAGERETAANAIEREAAVREAEERAQAALEAAERAAARRAAAARDERAAIVPPIVATREPADLAEPTTPLPIAPSAGVAAPPRSSSRRTRWPLIAAAVVVVLGLVAVGVFVVGSLGGEPTAPPTADVQLAMLIEEDEPTVAPIIENWLPQLSAKRLGIEDRGIVYGYDEILDDHRMHRQEYGAVLVDGGSYNFNLDGEQMEGWFMTIIPEPFDTSEGALTWCRVREIGRDSCFAKFVSSDSENTDGTIALQ